MEIPQNDPKRAVDNHRNTAQRDNTSTSNTATQLAQSPDGKEKVANKTKPAAQKITEIGGPKGLEPTRYGDWEAKGRCYDF